MECHSGKEASANLRFEKLDGADTITKHRKVWKKVAANILQRKMPPADQDRPEEDEIAQVTTWLREELGRFDCSSRHDPGRVTIRRLNRVEYNKTIRDLVGIDFTPTDDFPTDDVGYGFDNIGDVLSLSTLLLEKYVKAAEQIVARAIVTDDPHRPVITRLEKDALGLSGGNGGAGSGIVLEDGTRLITGLGSAFCDHYLRTQGDYIVRIKAYGEQAGPEPVRMSVQLDGRFVLVTSVAATRAEPAVFEKRIPIKEGNHRIAATFLNDFENPADPDPARRKRNLAVSWIELEGPLGLEPTPLPESHKRIFVVSPAPGGESEAARTIVRAFARRAFRRPVLDAEVERFAQLVDLARREGDTFEQGIQLAIQAILVSPHFLFRIETDEEPNNPLVARPVSEFELANRLSYFLWSTMPDEELFGQAAEGKLRHGQTLADETLRMLADPKSAALIENFASQWLQLRRLEQWAPDPGLFASFDEELRAAMREETLRFFAEVVREDRSILDLLDADFTYANERLARHYGLEGITGPEFRRVALPAGGPRGGVLTQASVLTITSNPTRTSPVKRGKWVLEELLGQPPPPPPPNVPELPEDKTALTGSLRQRMEQHRSNPNCAQCHARMDPLGFGLENFDAIGAWRDKDGEFAIDPSGSLPDGGSFAGPAELRAILRGRADEFRRCLVEKMLTYALGRGLEYYDQCAVDAICARLAEDGDRFSRLILEVVHSEPFQLRRGKGADE